MSRANDGTSDNRRLMRALRQVRDQSGWTMAAAELAWRDMPSEPLSSDAMRAILVAVIQRQAADPAFLVWQAWSEGVYWDKAGGIDPIVYEVQLDCRGLDRRQTSDLVRGMVEWEACLDNRELDARQWTWRHELRCDRADCDQGDVVGLFPEWF